ncbi:hypothetical protein QZH41_002908 [Actinostola sp. cb2023]|nr:hypothetical protein QZH41_002908 [Actinostola sp. cb2023]
MQEVLKDLIAEVMPALNAHFKYYGVDISTVTFNWFITVYLDAVPFEVLFRIAIGLLKLQERSLLQLSGYLEIMQYMKRAARVTYDIDRLFKVGSHTTLIDYSRHMDKASFDEITMFPNNEELDEMQKKYRSDIEAKNDFRLTVKHERKVIMTEDGDDDGDDDAG